MRRDSGGRSAPSSNHHPHAYQRLQHNKKKSASFMSGPSSVLPLHVTPTSTIHPSLSPLRYDVSCTASDCAAPCRRGGTCSSIWPRLRSHRQVMLRHTHLQEEKGVGELYTAHVVYQLVIRQLRLLWSCRSVFLDHNGVEVIGSGKSTWII